LGVSLDDFALNVALDIVNFAGEIQSKYLQKNGNNSAGEKEYSFEDLLNDKAVG